MPPVRALPRNGLAKGRTKGHSPEGKRISTAGQSHRREANSGGKAESTQLQHRRQNEESADYADYKNMSM